MKDINGIEVKVGDKVRGFGELRCQDGWSIDLTPIVTVKIVDDTMCFGGVSASLFSRFEIVERVKEVEE